MGSPQNVDRLYEKEDDCCKLVGTVWVGVPRYEKVSLCFSVEQMGLIVLLNLILEMAHVQWAIVCMSCYPNSYPKVPMWTSMHVLLCHIGSVKTCSSEKVFAYQFPPCALTTSKELRNKANSMCFGAWNFKILAINRGLIEKRRMVDC